MNPRKFLLSNLAWCPGIGAASRLVPDRDIPPRIMLAYALAVTGLFASTYMITYMGLTSIGFPSAEIVNINQISPKLVAAGDEMYLAAGVEVGHGSDFEENRKIYLGRMNVDGQVLNVNEVFDTDGSYLSNYDIIRTAEGEWFTIYNTRTLMSSLGTKFIRSPDGVNWENADSDNPPGTGRQTARLVETGDGDLLLFYTRFVGPSDDIGEGYVAYMATYSHQNGWSTPEQTPFKWMDVSSFRDIDGGISVVGITYVADEYRGYLSKLLADGSWSEPINLNYTGSSRVDILYSEHRNGYFLLGHGNSDNRYVQVCFSKDLRSLSVLETFAPAQDPTLVELTDGTLVLVYEKEFYKKVSNPSFFGTGVYGQWTELYATSSIDGVNWATPHSVEGLEAEAGLNIVSSSRRFLASVFLSVMVMFLLLLFLRYKRLF